MGKGGLVAYNQKDFWSLMFKIRGSIFDNVLPKLILTNVLCVVASVVQMASTDLLHSDGNNINNLAFTLAGSSISFLLVFRSQMSYNRFWEGRGHLGNIMFAGRDLARQISTCVQNDEGKSGAPSSMQAEQEKSWHVNGKPVQMGEYRQDAGVRAEFTKMTGFRRLQMLRILLIFWRLMVQHARDMKEPEFVGKLVLLKGEESNPDKVRYLTTPHLEYFLKAKARRPLCAVAILTRYIHQEYEEKNITNMEYRVRPHSHTRTPHTRASNRADARPVRARWPEPDSPVHVRAVRFTADEQEPEHAHPRLQRRGQSAHRTDPLPLRAGMSRRRTALRLARVPALRPPARSRCHVFVMVRSACRGQLRPRCALAYVPAC